MTMATVVSAAPNLQFRSQSGKHKNISYNAKTSPLENCSAEEIIDEQMKMEYSFKNNPMNITNRLLKSMKYQAILSIHLRVFLLFGYT